MNINNNKRKRESQEKIKKVFLNMIQKKAIDQINITDIVKEAEINRSTFYANYMDIYDLAEQIKDEMFNNVIKLYPEESLKKEHSYDYLTLFEHIKDNQIYYNTLFKLNFDFSLYYDTKMEKDEAIKFLGSTKNMEYHIEFFKSGMNAIIKKWLNNKCDISPEELNEILISEYKGRKKDTNN